MPESTSSPIIATDGDALAQRVADAAAGLVPLLAEAQEVWRARAFAAGKTTGAKPGWRSFEDAFPTFYQFTNRPR